MCNKRADRVYIRKLFHIQGYGELDAAFRDVSSIAIQTTRARTVCDMGGYLDRNLTSFLDFGLLSVVRPRCVCPLAVLIFALRGH